MAPSAVNHIADPDTRRIVADFDDLAHLLVSPAADGIRLGGRIGGQEQAMLRVPTLV
jgi:hypothetical protein